MKMQVVCFDLEGVFTPEIWINVAEATGIEALRLTTRDLPDYDQLMTHRLQVLDQAGLRIADILRVIAELHPLAGASAFLDQVRQRFQVVIASDTFYDFAGPLMAQLGHPLLLAHHLKVDPGGRIIGYELRLPDQKRAAVKRFRQLGFTVFAVGDSYNDTAMLLEADQGFLFCPPQKVIDEFPQLPVVIGYEELLGKLDETSSGFDN